MDTMGFTIDTIAMQSYKILLILSKKSRVPAPLREKKTEVYFDRGYGMNRIVFFQSKI